MIGRKRSMDAQMKLFDYTGFAMLTYTIKQEGKEFVPVGEEMLIAIMNNDETNESMLFICDSDGFAKAQSKPISRYKANDIYRKIVEDGMAEYKGVIKTVS